MPFIPNTEKQRQEMLRECGVEKFEDLVSTIPKKFLHLEKCKKPDALSELEITRKMNELAAKNQVQYNSFLGAGVYDHFIPAAVDHIISRPEFLTAYTPYQAEVSQGTLQYIYEYQSLICQLTGAEIANAGMYDGASACAEAILMAVRHTKKNKAIICGTIHPYYKEVIKAYTEGENIELVYIPEKNGQVDLQELKYQMNDSIAGGCGLSAVLCASRRQRTAGIHGLIAGGDECSAGIQSGYCSRRRTGFGKCDEFRRTAFRIFCYH